jgi:ABC-2 type transport system permease protein
MAWAEWRRLRREPLALLFVVILPLALVSVVGPVYAAGNEGENRLGVVAEGDGPVAGLVTRTLAGSGDVDVHRYRSRTDAEEALRDRSVDGVVVIPAAVEEGAPVDLVLVGSPGIVAPTGIRAEVERTAADVSAALAVADRDGGGAGGWTSEALRRAERAVATAVPARRDAGPDPDERRQSGLASAILGILVLFTFMNGMARSEMVPSYRELSILGRLRATGTSAREAAAGFALSITAFAVVQTAVILGGATVLLGVRWSTPGPLLLVALVVGIAAGCLGTLTGTFLASTTSGATVAGPIGFTLGMLGGALWPLEIVPPVARTIGHLTPQAWAVDALNAAGGLDEGAGGWGGPTFVLIGYAAVLLAAAVLRLRRSVAGGL